MADIIDLDTSIGDGFEVPESKPKRKGKGNPEAYKNSPFVGNNAIKATDTDMAKYWDNALTVYHWPKIDFSDDSAVEGRCALYLEHCRDKLERPTVEGLAVAIGCGTSTLQDWESGRTRGESGGSRSAIIKKAKTLIQYMLAQMAVGNKIYPNVWIFYGKNWFGMKDTQEVIVTPNNALESIPLDEIEKRIPADIPVDADWKEE